MESGFLGQAYMSRSRFTEGERLINLYPFVTDKNIAGFIACPGFSVYCDLGTDQEVRALHETKKGKLYAVSGNKVFYIQDGNKTEIGTIYSSSGQVEISSNPTQLFVVDGSSGYIVSLDTNTFSVIADGDFPSGTTTNVFCETYTICAIEDTQSIQISSQNDSSSWDSLDFTSAESFPDNVVRLGVLRRELYAFGTKSVEIFARDYSSSFAFSRLGNIFIEAGIYAPKSLARVKDIFCFLGQNEEGGNNIYIIQNYQLDEISTPAIHYALEKMTTTSDAIGFCYQQDGGSFYCLVLPTEGKCFAYDFSVKQWHERAFFENGNYTRYRANCCAYHDRKTLVGDYSNGLIYQLDLDVHDYNGTPRRWLRTWNIPKAENKLVEVSNLSLMAEMGVGLDGTNDNTDPVVSLRVSKDAGFTFTSELTRKIGKIGETKTAARWNRIGQARNPCFELTGSHAVKTVLIDMTMDIEVL